MQYAEIHLAGEKCQQHFQSRVPQIFIKPLTCVRQAGRDKKIKQGPYHHELRGKWGIQRHRGVHRLGGLQSGLIAQGHRNKKGRETNFLVEAHRELGLEE